jgi:MSHA biogenesis protein MshE
MYFVLEGTCQAFLSQRHLAIERELRQYGPGSYFGEIALVSGSRRAASVRALSPVTALVLLRRDLMELMRGSTDMALAFCEGLAGYVTELLRDAGLRYVVLDEFPNIAACQALIPARVSRHCRAIAIEKVGDQVKVAIVDPADQRSRDFLKSVLRSYRVEFVAVGERDFEQHAKKYLSAAADDTAPALDDEIEVSAVSPAGEEPMGQSEIGALLQSVFAQALRLGASDVHMEPAAPAGRVRIRVDGSMLGLDDQIPMPLFPQLVSRLKILGGMDITERRLPQDGRFALVAGGRPIEVRASVLPCQGGEKVVLRLLQSNPTFSDLASLVVSNPLTEIFREMFLAPSGLVLVCGPTGSGKTTTLYAGLHEIWRASPTVNIITIEDPIEYQVPFATQVPLNRPAGFDFPQVLRTALRQDPDILLVGEIRDAESAATALEAATTGHLVLSSLHTDFALETLGRLRHLCDKSYLIAAGLRGVINQVLLPRVCRECAVDVSSDDASLAKLRRRGVMPPEGGPTPKRGRGCAACRFKGDIGRVAVFEALCIDETIRGLIEIDRPIEEVRANLHSGNFVSRADYARMLLSDGIVAPEKAAELFPATSFSADFALAAGRT